MPAKIRSKGGQPGNTNALKHGFYSRFFSPVENNDIPSISNSLSDEILLLRVLIRRYSEAVMNEPSLDYDTAAQALNSISSSTVRLATLLRTDKLLSTDSSPILNAINDALESFASNLDP